ncbi:peptidoglycan-binding domain-containing protein [Streptomyces sp. NPDC020362]|uniref:peptidoglycan-binding domain-containing protein n=1 Tax=unclassified Streptomyces TaxID=2593676 RepID=UPI000ACB59BE
MTGPTGPRSHGCPECGAPRESDNTPSCDCTRRASDALREARTAQAAAAEDFDPLRIRPYVEVTDASEDGAAAPTVPVPSVEITRPLAPVPGPSTTDLRLFAPKTPHAPPAPGDEDPAAEPRRRPRRTFLLSVAGAGLAVVAAAGVASGLFSYHTPSRDRAAQEVRESVPEVTTPDASSASAPAPPPAAAPTRPATPSRSPSAAPSRSIRATPSPLNPTASRSPSGRASATPSATTTRTPNAAPTGAPVLRRGDQGPAVTELQLRLQQLNLYDDPADGVFSSSVEDAVATYQWARGITEDAPGVYGPTTRAGLESETSAP